MLFTHLDKIYYTSKEMMGGWSKEHVKLKVLKSIINMLHMSTKTENVKVNAYNKDVNALMNNIYTEMEGLAKRLNYDYVPFTKLKECIDVVKNSFNEGLKKAS